MKTLDKLIPLALQAVPDLFKSESDKVVLKEYDGYAASLGAAIRTSGLIPALAFYTDVHKDKEGSEEARRYKVLQALARILEIEETPGDRSTLLNQVIAVAYGSQALDPQAAIGDPDPAAIKEWTQKILNASIALKLALRNFPHSE